MDAEDARGAGGRDGSDDRALWRPAADPGPRPRAGL